MCVCVCALSIARFQIATKPFSAHFNTAALMFYSKLRVCVCVHMRMVCTQRWQEYDRNSQAQSGSKSFYMHLGGIARDLAIGHMCHFHSGSKKRTVYGMSASEKRFLILRQSFWDWDSVRLTIFSTSTVLYVSDLIFRPLCFWQGKARQTGARI